MKKIIILGVLNLLLVNVFAQKDPQAWKKEKTLESQYSTLKVNANKWDGFIMVKEPPLNEFHNSILDTIKGLEETIVVANTSVVNAKKELSVLSKELSETKESLKASLSKEDELITLGMPVNKKTFPTIVYSIIIVMIVICLFVFFLFFRSNAITKETEKNNQKLTDELKAQKTRALERENKLARELQTERNKNYS